MGRGPKTTNSQKLAIIHWLEDIQNFELITGKAAESHEQTQVDVRLLAFA